MCGGGGCVAVVDVCGGGGGGGGTRGVVSDSPQSSPAFVCFR